MSNDDIFETINTILGGNYARMVIILLIAFVLAWLLIFRLAKNENFGVLLIFSGIFVMLANPIGVDKTPLTFFIGLFEVVIGIYISIKRSDI